MGRNIVILADGTGQRGGVLVDERRSNIYKLFRACRCGPDSAVDPGEQFAFYDPGIGTLPKGVGLFGAVWQWLYNLICQATGLGLTGNIVDCYAAIIRNWRPGDRIWLLGFSRGAYTARCVAAVIAKCGVPTRMANGSALRLDEASCRAMASEAVKRVYQHVSSPRDSAFIAQREALAARFRQQHASGTSEEANVYPHFIGVFDTVAAIGSWGSIGVVAALWTGAAVLIGGVCLWFFHAFWTPVGIYAVLSAAAALVAFVVTHLKFATGLADFPFWKTVHFTSLRMKFYDQQLNKHVGWARHALAIDEWRADFDRVPWASSHDMREVLADEPRWLRQVWFAGDHSDIGGSYPEPESRLSDVALQWMVEEATAIPEPLHLDRNVLKLYPSATGIQHDETRGWAFRFGKRLLRGIKPDAELHPTVVERVKAAEVLNCDRYEPYRPANLREHAKTKALFSPGIGA